MTVFTATRIAEVVSTETGEYASQLANSAGATTGEPDSIEVTGDTTDVTITIRYRFELTPAQSGPLADNVRDALKEADFPGSVVVLIRTR